MEHLALKMPITILEMPFCQQFDAVNRYPEMINGPWIRLHTIITPDRFHLIDITQFATAMGAGTASGQRLSSSGGGRKPVMLELGRVIMLEDVYVVLASAVSLLSAQQMACICWSIVINEDKVTISKDTEVLQRKMNNIHRLCTTALVPSQGSALATSPEPVVDITLQDQHKRIRHIERLKLLGLAYNGELRVDHAAVPVELF